MLSFEELPQHILDIYARCQQLAGEIYGSLEHAGEPALVPAGTDLLDGGSSHCVYVRDGCFKLYQGGRLVRLYNAGDFVNGERMPELVGWRIEAPFAAKVTRFERERLSEELGRSATLRRAWLAHQELEVWLLLLLCAHHMGEDAQPDLRIQTIEAGDVLLREGETSGEIFSLIEGEARVTVKDVEVGVIKAGELFGEISFLTDQPCVATVTATENGLLHAVKKADFHTLVQCRPQMMIQLARTLALRLASLDEKLTSAGAT